MFHNETNDTATLPAIFATPKAKAVEVAIGPPTLDELQAIATARAGRLETKMAALIRQRPELEFRVLMQLRSLESAEAALKANQDEADRLGEIIESSQGADGENFTPTPAELAYRDARLREAAALARMESARQAADEARHRATEFGRDNPIVSRAQADAIDSRHDADKEFDRACSEFGAARGNRGLAQHNIEREKL